jgi:hypothetical protein
MCWLGGQPFIGSTIHLLALPRTLAFIDIDVL